MRPSARLVALAMALALFGSACTAAPLPRPSEGPSQFLKSFSLRAVVASINATPNGPRCPGPPVEIASAHERRDSSFGGSSTAWHTASCTDPGDGTALAQAWAAGINAELNRLGASVLMSGIGTTEAGEEIQGEWGYLSSSLRGQITVQVLPGPDGHYWTIVRIFESS